MESAIINLSGIETSELVKALVIRGWSMRISNVGVIYLNGKPPSDQTATKLRIWQGTKDKDS